MAFTRPSLTELISRNQSDIESRLPGTDAKTRRTVVGVLARVLSGAVHGLYGYLDWASKQLMADTAEAEHLDRHAGIWLQEGRKAAVAALGSVDFTGTDGSVIPAGSLLQRSDGVVYATDAEVTIAASVATATVTASDAGADGNSDAGVGLSLISPIAGIQSSATVATGGLTGGADIESDDDLRARVIARIQNPPQGGSESDYLAWALAAHVDVTRAWVYGEELGAGTVVVMVATDDVVGGPIPVQSVVDAVQAYIDVRRPVTAAVTAVAPVAVPFNLTISNLSPDTSTVRSAIEAEIADLLRREAGPGGTILLSHIREAISLAADEADHVLVSPAADVTHTTGQIAMMGTITWQ